MIHKAFISTYWSMGVIILYLFIALFASVLAGENPVICIDKGKISFPAFNHKYVSSNEPVSSGCLLPLIPYSASSIDPLYKSGISPLDTRQSGIYRFRHWLGTDKLGRDVAAGMIHGTAVALKIGFLSVLFSFLAGVSLGLAAGYFQDNTLRIGLAEGLISFIILVLGLYYIWMESMVFRNDFFNFITGCGALFFILYLVKRIFKKYNERILYPIPIDTLVLKLIEIRKSFPGIFLLLALISIFSVPSVWNIVLIITLLGWADFARLARGETLAIKNENYIKSATILGLGDSLIILRHILPNIMPTLIVAICFGIGGAVLLESTLSFLGVGLPVESVSWGKMLSEGRNMKYWWLVLFPGLAIFILILALNSIASRWQKSNFRIIE